ncbi:TPA: rod shape-determining protein [Candidatus Dependentiae bacterium]|nr:MAG: Cell shape determining protein, MreB/Mrl family [candidate division TM6 bacterium GW2011_GWF2_36_131]KKQ03492.1 MAG: Cell shape determining protein, MreB/Mrl family [candidate division TM6 bacterium GW2011_GWE2_36_25]KKQ20234.1 MAG: Cell shape determining protein, MreB/Mrl family [candidate division TM6 bacterium GW2011_GWA2_36_9]HBR70773.1 rod shape-determining protein [Candidatus Dependentiae bacterium]HCU00158.1 rod shape-determining protein [Candidatus Dependentiae bacterium]
MKNLINKVIPARRLFSFFSNDMAIDLGTANTLVFAKNKGIVLDEPSVVAVKISTNQVIAAGKVAKDMLGRTPENIIACRPLRDGVIADFEKAEAMLRYFIRKVHDNRRTLVSPRMIIGVPSGITQVELRAVEESAKQAGVREDRVFVIKEPIAAAIGAGLPIHEPCANMIVDIGGGTTEVAVITLMGEVFCRSIRVGGDEMDDAIVQYCKRKYNLLIGERTAEQIKISIGTVMPEKSRTAKVKGRDLITGVPKTIDLTSDEVNEALLETICQIIDIIKVALENTPPELSSDLVDNGIVLAGGGSMLNGLDKLISKETKLPVRVAENPLLCVVNGAGQVLDKLDFFKDVLISG